MGDIKRQPAKKKHTASRLELTEDRERWLARGSNICDWELPFEECFVSKKHAKELWKKYREKLINREFQFIWFGSEIIEEDRNRMLWGQKTFDG